MFGFATALKPVGLWDINPVNLFRINWHNDHNTGLFGGVNCLEIPGEITGVAARVIGIALNPPRLTINQTTPRRMTRPP